MTKVRIGGALPRQFPIDLVGVMTAIGAVMVLYGGIRAFYYQGPFLDAISSYIDERTFNEIVNSWIGRDPQQTLFGIHAFGDYTLPNVWASVDDPWSRFGMVNYLPPVLVAFRVLGLMPYPIGFGLYEAALFIALLLPLVWASRGRPWSERILITVILGLLTGPAIATLDRGNTQGFLPLLLYFFALAVLREKWGWASILLAVAGVIKVYPLVLVLVFIALRRYRWALVSLGLVAAVSMVGLVVMSRDPVGALPDVLGDVLRFQQRDFSDFMTRNISLSGGLAHGLTFVGLPALGHWIAGHAAAIGVLYLLLVAPLLWISRIDLWLRLILGMMLMTGVTPVVYEYALNWVIAASALAVSVSAGSRTVDLALQGRLARPLRVVLLGSLAAVGVAYPFFIPGTMESGMPTSPAALAVAAASVAVPICLWLTMLMSRIRSQGG